jgi:hypothetical protein
MTVIVGFYDESFLFHSLNLPSIIFSRSVLAQPFFALIRRLQVKLRWRSPPRAVLAYVSSGCAENPYSYLPLVEFNDFLTPVKAMNNDVQPKKRR